jgi:hypothetical protein
MLLPQGGMTAEPLVNRHLNASTRSRDALSKTSTALRTSEPVPSRFISLRLGHNSLGSRPANPVSQ